MSDDVGVPKWFWVVGTALLLWGATGIFFFYSQLTMTYDQLVASMGKAGADWFVKMPRWLWWAFGIAVWSGTFGSITLLIRRAWAQPLYLISLISVVVQFGYFFGVAKMHEILGASSAIFPAFIILMAVFELWFATRSKKKGWLS